MPVSVLLGSATLVLCRAVLPLLRVAANSRECDNEPKLIVKISEELES